MVDFKTDWERLNAILAKRETKTSWAQLAKELKVSTRTIHKLKNDKKLAYSTHIRIEQWLEEQESLYNIAP